MHIVIKDGNGKKQRIEISKELLEFFYEEHKREEKERYEKRKHIDCYHTLDNYIVLMKAITETLEETFFRQERFRKIIDLASSCTPAQQKRFYLHFFGGYTYREIAKIENCGVGRIQKSIEKVLKKIKNDIKD